MGYSASSKGVQTYDRFTKLIYWYVYTWLKYNSVENN